jgi:endonuclease/exonuclease/phosphatase (EEP) superfamily protein YafD
VDASPDLHDDAPVRIVTWNMGLADRRRRFAERHEEAWRYVLALSPDLAFLQESFPPHWVEDQGTIVRDPFRKWGSLIFSPTLAIEQFALPEDSPLRALPNYLALTDVQLSDGTSTLAGSIHAPPRRAEGDILGKHHPEELRRSVEGPKYNDAIFAGLVPIVEGRRFLLAGDWNTARRQGTERDSRIGEQFFARVGQAGWHDCVWSKHYDELKTWFGPGRLQQDDYVFCDRSLGASVEEVFVAEDAATEEQLSDHAPLIVDFGVG